MQGHKAQAFADSNRFGCHSLDQSDSDEVSESVINLTTDDIQSFLQHKIENYIRNRAAQLEQPGHRICQMLLLFRLEPQTPYTQRKLIISDHTAHQYTPQWVRTASTLHTQCNNARVSHENSLTATSSALKCFSATEMMQT